MTLRAVRIRGPTAAKVLSPAGAAGSLGSEARVCGFDLVSGANTEWHVPGIVSGTMICLPSSRGFVMPVELLITPTSLLTFQRQ